MLTNRPLCSTIEATKFAGYTMGKNSCKTYFIITGQFDPHKLTKALEIEPFKQHTSTDLRRDGKPFGFCSWCACLCQTYDPIVANQMEKTIEPLLGKEELLQMICQEGNCQLGLSVVPHVYVNEPSPCLAPSHKVMNFCLQTGTELDIDLYTYNSDDE